LFLTFEYEKIIRSFAGVRSAGGLFFIGGALKRTGFRELPGLL
jgi:hypothetical protein